MHLVKLIRTHNPPGLRHFLPVAMDLVKRLDKVIDSFEAQPRGATADAARTFVREVYQQFEMVMFNQSFLQARLQPMVEAHINAVVAGSVPGKTELEGVLSMIGERGAVADLFTKGGMSQNDGQKLKIDLASARSTNLQSLEVLQQIFGDTLEDEISYLRQRAKNPVYDAKAVRSEAYRRSLRDARNSGFVSRDTSTDRFSRTFVDWVLLAKPRAAMARAMNLDLYPMPADGGFEGFSDDESKSFATMWSYLCVQALSMPDRKRYHRLCSGSSHGIAEYPNMPESMRGMLNLNHDDWWSDHEITRRPSEEGWTGGDPICTLYDFQRRWKIYHMAAERYFD
ncbi:MAG: hypothetical protein NTV34_18090 [Proteobacteria bacterium]|nr:hypothetical protein [Pseudomonadota bacterium]